MHDNQTATALNAFLVCIGSAVQPAVALHAQNAANELATQFVEEGNGEAADLLRGFAHSFAQVHTL